MHHATVTHVHTALGFGGGVLDAQGRGWGDVAPRGLINNDVFDLLLVWELSIP